MNEKVANGRLTAESCQSLKDLRDEREVLITVPGARWHIDATKWKQRRFASDMLVKLLAIFRLVSPKPLLQLVLYLLLFSTAAVPRARKAVEKKSENYRPEIPKGFTPKERIAYNSIVHCIQRRYKSDAQETFEKYDKDNDGIASVGEILRFFEDCQLEPYFRRKRWVERAIGKLDKDQDGKLSVYDLHQATIETAPISFKLTEACYDKECVARTGPRNRRL